MSKHHIKTSVKVDNLPEIPDLEKPILEISVTNPFKKILYWLDQIRRKQTTTFAIKLSIPLIAIPVIAFVFFQLGKNFALPLPLPMPLPTSNPTPITELEPDLTISRAGILKIARGKTTRYLLNLKDGRIIVLELPLGADINRFQNKQVLVTGPYDRNTATMKVEDIAEIELLHEVSVSPTPTASPSATPEAQ